MSGSRRAVCGPLQTLPAATLKRSDVALGSLLASLLFMPGKQFMVLYFAHIRSGSTCGAAGSSSVECIRYSESLAYSHVHTLRMSHTINTTTRTVPSNPNPSISFLL